MRHFDRNGNITTNLGSLRPGEQVTFAEGGDIFIVMNPGFNGVCPLVGLRGWNLTFGRHDDIVFVLPPEREWRLQGPRCFGDEPDFQKWTISA